MLIYLAYCADLPDLTISIFILIALYKTIHNDGHNSYNLEICTAILGLEFIYDFELQSKTIFHR